MSGLCSKCWSSCLYQRTCLRHCAAGSRRAFESRKNEPQWPVGSREPVAPLKVWEACKEVPQSRVPHNPVVMGLQEWEDRYTCVAQGCIERVEGCPVRC